MIVNQIADVMARMNQKQRLVVWITAFVILAIQLLMFISEGMIDGYGWIFSVFVAGLLFVASFAKPSLAIDSAKLSSADALFEFSSQVNQKIYHAIKVHIGELPFVSEKMDINFTLRKVWQIESIIFAYVFVAVCGAVYHRAYLSSGRFVNYKSQVRRELRREYRELSEVTIPVSGSMSDDQMADRDAGAALEKADLVIRAICQNPSPSENTLWDPLFKSYVTNIGLSKLETPQARDEFFGPIVKPLMKQYKALIAGTSPSV